MLNKKNQENNPGIASTLKGVVAAPGEVGRLVQKELANVLHRAANPLRVEFKLKDLLQIIIGATILAIPVGFTEETWHLGRTLPLENIIMISLVSIIFIGTFVYYMYDRDKSDHNAFEHVKRIASTYIFSLAVVAGFLTIIQVAPWGTEWVIALKRVILISLPASMSAVVADTIK
jgi:uncharacterized membrane protein